LTLTNVCTDKIFANFIFKTLCHTTDIELQIFYNVGYG